MSGPSQLPLPTVAETVRRAGLGEDAAALAGDNPSPEAYLDRLRDGSKFGEAARYLAFALPKREAVWWACRCARLAPGGPQPGAEGPAAKALDAAERWVADPGEPNRRTAGATGEAIAGTPAGCAALAAFWSGGSLAPEGQPTVPPADDLTPRGVAGAVMLAGVIAEPEKAPERYRTFHEVGLAIAAGTDRWTGASPSPAPGPMNSAKAATPTPTPTPPRTTTTSRFRDTWE